MEIHISETVSEANEISTRDFNVAMINSIAVKHKELRQQSKAPTFALT